MILKTFITTIVILILYSVFVSAFAPRWWISAQSQWQTNLSKGQNFLYDNSDTVHNVILGSSLSARLVVDSLPNTYSLSFSGKGAFDGLNILAEKAEMPKRVFIETNVINRPPSPEFTDLINNSIMYYPRKYLLGLREDKQPIAILGLMQINGLKGIVNSVFKRPIKADVLAVMDKPDEINPLFGQLLEIQLNYYSKQPDLVSLDSLFMKLKQHVRKLENKGVKVVFFEMPVHKDLQTLPLSTVIRNGFQKNFPASKYSYITIPNTKEFHTTDGIHLGKNEALTFTMFFKTKMDQIN